MQIKISQIIADLESGLTRTSKGPGSTGYNPTVGCIKDKYNLTSAQMTTLFNHPALKGKRTLKVNELLEIIDDTETATSTSASANTASVSASTGVAENMPYANDTLTSGDEFEDMRTEELEYEARVEAETVSRMMTAAEIAEANVTEA